MPQPWWEKYDGLLEEEIQKLKDAGFRCEVDEELKQRGLLSLHLYKTQEGKEMHLEARYPEDYPYFRPEVFTDDVRLPRHQNPRAGNLCLLERSTTVWHTEYSLAGLLEKKLERTIKAGIAKTVEETGIEEVPQPEPISEYMTFTPGSILYDGSWTIPPEIGQGLLRFSIVESDNSFVAAILAVEDDKGKQLMTADEVLINTFKQGVVREGRWIRISNILDFTDNLKDMDPKSLLTKLLNQDPRFNSIKDTQYDIIGILFREETEHRLEGDGWIFLLRHFTQSDIKNKKGQSSRPRMISTPYLFRGGRAGFEDLKARVPIRGLLKSKKVTVFGLGCIGAPIVLELARAGVGELRVMDSDFVEPGNAIRWPLGFVVAGKQKVSAIDEFIRHNIPYSKVVCKYGKVGAVVFPDEFSEGMETPGQMVDTILEGTDLIIDATGEDGVNHFLSEQAQEKGIPIIFVATTVGTWGGDIVRIIPGKTPGCWACYGFLQKEGTLPKPPKDSSPEAAEVVPRGCSAPTFTGNQFDATIVSMACVRTVIGTLLRKDGGYPNLDDDVMIICLRGNDGSSIIPTFKTYPLERHKLCKSRQH